MGLPVLVLGESGTGKSTSLRNFKPEDLKVINVANKPLPFKNKFESVSTDNYSKIIAELKLNKKKVVVIDDAQYLMANEFMRRATERGFDKFTEIAQNFWTLVNSVKDLPNDVVVYFMAHIERDANGNEKIKTIGKLLDEKITVEGMFTIVLKTNVTDGVYSFLTQNNGHDTVKSPLGMFPTYAIDNDLKYVDEKIRNYYELGEFLSDQDLAEIEETVKREDVPIKEEKKKRGSRRGEEKKEEPAEALEEEAKEEPADEKPKRRRAKGNISDDNGTNEGTDEEPEENPKGTGDSEKGESVPEETPKRRSRRKSAGEEIVNAGIEEADGAESVPFDEVETPEPPRRKSRKKAEEPVEEAPAEEPTTEEAPKRRRRRG